MRWMLILVCSKLVDKTEINTCNADLTPVVSKLTLVRSKTDNVLVIKNKQPAAGQRHRHRRHHHHHQRPEQQPQAVKSRAGRALKPKRPRLASESGVDQQDKDQDQDTQCKIVRVILENCSRTSTTTTTTSTTKTGGEGSSASPDTAVEGADGDQTNYPPQTPTSTGPAQPPSTLLEASSSVSAAVSTAAVPVDLGGLTVMPKTSSQLACSASSGVEVSVASVLPAPAAAAAAALRLAAPINGVVSQLPLALGQRLQLLGSPHPAARALAPARWSVPLVNGTPSAPGTWFTLQPVVTSTSPGLLPVQGPPAVVAPARPPPPRQGRAHSYNSSVINSPIKQFLDHTRSVPPPPQTPPQTPVVLTDNNDVPTDLSMKTLRRLEEDWRSAVPPSTPVVSGLPAQDEDAPLDLCTKRPSPTDGAVKPQSVDTPAMSVSTTPTTKPSPVLPILTVPLCFPPGPTDNRPRLAVAGQAGGPSTVGVNLVQPPPAAVQPLVKLDTAPGPAAATAFPVSPITILHPAFRQLSPFLCSSLLMTTPFAPGAASLQRHPPAAPSDACVTSSAASSS